MFIKLFILFVTVPFVELAILLLLSQYGIGWLWTLALVVVTGIGGAWLANWQGTQAWARIRADLGAGQMPTNAVTDTVLIFLAGAFLMTPGVLTDLFGFTLLIPPGRTLVKYYLFRWFKSQFNIQTIRAGEAGMGPRGDRVIDSHVVESESPDDDEV